MSLRYSCSNLSHGLIWHLNFHRGAGIFQGGEIYTAIYAEHALMQDFQPEVLVGLYRLRREADSIIMDRQREIIPTPFGQYRDFFRPRMFFYIAEQLFECEENCTLDFLRERMRVPLGLKIQFEICARSYFPGMFHQQIR